LSKHSHTFDINIEDQELIEELWKELDEVKEKNKALRKRESLV